jgi:hypothetical protein
MYRITSSLCREAVIKSFQATFGQRNSHRLNRVIFLENENEVKSVEHKIAGQVQIFIHSPPGSGPGPCTDVTPSFLTQPAMSLAHIGLTHTQSSLLFLASRSPPCRPLTRDLETAVTEHDKFPHMVSSFMRFLEEGRTWTLTFDF